MRWNLRRQGSEAGRQGQADDGMGGAIHARPERRSRERFAKEKPLKGVRIAACLHVTTETGNSWRP